MIKVVFLGTAGYHASETRETSCVFLPDFGIVLDAGSGFRRLYGKVPTHIEELNILISHAHLDHVIGLIYFFNLYKTNPHLKKLHIFGFRDHIDAIQNNLFHQAIFPVAIQNAEFHSLPLLWTAWKSTPNVIVRSMRLCHQGEALGYRFHFLKENKHLAYITDTMVDECYLPLIKNVDLLIHECNYPDSKPELAKLATHSMSTEVLTLAEKANVKKLALFHFDPLDEGGDPSGVWEARANLPFCPRCHLYTASDFHEIYF
jgi:ribonuclease Z